MQPKPEDPSCVISFLSQPGRRCFSQSIFCCLSHTFRGVEPTPIRALRRRRGDLRADAQGGGAGQTLGQPLHHRQAQAGGQRGEKRGCQAVAQQVPAATSSSTASTGIGQWRSATPARALGGSARTERYARRCLTTGSPARRESSFSVHFVNKQPNRWLRDPYDQWCGRGAPQGASLSRSSLFSTSQSNRDFRKVPPIKINHHSFASKHNTCLLFRDTGPG